MQSKIPAITLTPKPSRQLAAWYLVIHVSALLVMLSAPVTPAYKLPLLLLIILFGIVRLRGYDVNREAKVMEANIESSGRSRIVLGNGRRVAATLRRDSLMTPWVVLLRFDVRYSWHHPAMVLFQDAIPEEQMRRLRVLLKHGAFHQNGE